MRSFNNSFDSVKKSNDSKVTFEEHKSKENTSSLSFGDSVSMFKKGTFSQIFNNRTKLIVLENSPSVFIKHVPNFKDLPVIISQGHLKTAMGEKNSSGHQHFIKDETLVKLPQALEKPMILFRHADYPNNVNAILNLSDNDGRKIVVAIKPNSENQPVGKINHGSYEIEILNSSNLIKTVFGLGDNMVDSCTYVMEKVSDIYYPKDMTKKKLVYSVAMKCHSGLKPTSDFTISNKD